jgi:hypothetical protein
VTVRDGLDPTAPRGCIATTGGSKSTLISFNDFDVDGCNISKVILFLQKLALSPNASCINVAFTNHITNALMKIREKS